MVNKKMANILGMDMPEEDVETTELIPVEPHELVDVGNPNLPPTHDIDRKQLQGEKQLEEVIQSSLGYQKDLFDMVQSTDPKYRSRVIEVANGTLGLALDAIKIKLETQLKMRDQRRKDAEFKGRGEEGGRGGTTNNYFFGSREELLAAIDGKEASDEGDD